MNKWVLTYRICIAVIILLVMIALASLFGPQLQRYRQLRNREAALQEEIRQQQEILRYLREQQQRLLNDPRFVEKVAREELRYVKPGETVFRFLDDEPSTQLEVR